MTTGTPYAVLRELVAAAEPATVSPAHLRDSADAAVFRARILRALHTPAARQRRRSLLLCARAYYSLARARLT